MSDPDLGVTKTNHCAVHRSIGTFENDFDQVTFSGPKEEPESQDLHGHPLERNQWHHRVAQQLAGIQLIERQRGHPFELSCSIMRVRFCPANSRVNWNWPFNCQACFLYICQKPSSGKSKTQLPIFSEKPSFGMETQFLCC